MAAMKASVSGGAIKEFTAEQVQAWKIGDEEVVDGETYQTGLAAYKAETIFGPKTVQAKALIKGGKVVKWIYAKTGMEIRSGGAPSRAQGSSDWVERRQSPSGLSSGH